MALLQNHPPVSNPFKGRTVGRKFQAVTLMALTSALLLGAFASRLAQLQLIQGERNQQLADNNRIRLVPKRPVRGAILDRNGKILAGSRLSHSVSLWPIALSREEWPAIISRLSTVLNIPQEEILKRLEAAGYDSIEAVTIARGISPAQATALAEYGLELEGVRLEAEAVRNYPNGDWTAHVLGFTGEMTDEQLKSRIEEGYRLGDVIGQMGAESAFESQLRGTWGGQQVEVDSAGRVLSILGEKPAQPGQDVQLTLDLELQKAAERALGELQGSIIVMEPDTGAILAMASWPVFDPNIFSTRITEEQWAQLQGARFPFLNRSLRAFPPASTFKIVTTAAAIDLGQFSPNLVLPTYPFVAVGGIQFWDWNKAGFGPLGFTGAMAMSSDTFFYQIAQRLGGEPLIEMTRRFGFGKKTGIEIGAEESPGLVPDDSWKREVIEEPWMVGDSINMSIGQGYLQATPLQVTVMFAITANGGYKVTPHLLKDEKNLEQWRENIGLSDITLDVLQRGLREVITDGTAQFLNDPELPPIAGKTGTAEAPPYENHSWFGAYAPANDPEILVVSFGEHSGGGGGSVAAPIVKEFLDFYYKERAKTAASQ